MCVMCFYKPSMWVCNLFILALTVHGFQLASVRAGLCLFPRSSLMLYLCLSVLKGRVLDVVHFVRVKNVSGLGNACTGLTREKVLLPGISSFTCCLPLIVCFYVS